MSDSTNADVLGSTLGERSIASSLAQITEETKGAMFVALFASNVHRLRILLDIAKQSGRKLVIAGRSMMTHVGIAQMAGLLPGSSGLILSPDQATAVPRNRWLVLCTGSQGEPTSALARIADGTHPHVSVKSGDAVVFSARVIPGNERAVSLMVDDLLRQGARVTTPRNDARLHVSGHAQREEQAEMIALTMPKNFVPIHGTLALMQAHAELARAAGVERVAVVENGTSLVLQGERLAPSHRFASGAVAVAYGKDIPDEVLTEREDLASRGFANVTLAFDAGRREPRVSVALVGCAHRDRQHEIERALASSIVRETGDAKDAEGGLAERVRLLTRRFVEREVGARPTVAVRILQA